jgi:hypothetical protein
VNARRCRRRAPFPSTCFPIRTPSTWSLPIARRADRDFTVCVTCKLSALERARRSTPGEAA